MRKKDCIMFRTWVTETMNPELHWMKISLEDTTVAKWMPFANIVERLDKRAVERYCCLIYKNILLNKDDCLTAMAMKKRILRRTFKTTTAFSFASFRANITPPAGWGFFCFWLQGQVYHSEDHEVWTTLHCKRKWSTTSSQWSNWK